MEASLQTCTALGIWIWRRMQVPSLTVRRYLDQNEVSCGLFPLWCSLAHWLAWFQTPRSENCPTLCTGNWLKTSSSSPLSSSSSFFSSSSIRSLTSSQRTSAGLGEFSKASNWREATCWFQFLFSGLPQESPGSLITYAHMKGLIFAFPYFDNHVYLSKRRAEAQCSIVVLTANTWAGRHPGRKFFHSFSRAQAKINTESLIFFVMNWQLICLDGRTC